MSQHDMNLADQAGSAFRADLNNALAALVTNSSGATEPATISAYQFWADTTAGLLKQRNAANSAWITVGTLASANLGLLPLAGGALTGRLDFAAGADIASAATINLAAATGNIVRVTGTTATTAVTLNNGQYVVCYAVGAWPLTYHATNMPLPGSASYTCATGDMVIFSKDGNGAIHIEIVPVSLHPAIVSQAVAEAGTDTAARLWTAERVKQAIAALSTGGLTSGTVVDTSTGATSYTVTGISGAKFISFGFGGISTNGTSSVMFRIGPSGGVVSTGYVGAIFDNTTATVVTDGFYVDNFGAAAAVRHGRATLQLIDAATNTWSWESSVLSSDSNRAKRTGSGTISLAGALERFQIIANGTDTFDAGKLNYLIWE